MNLNKLRSSPASATPERCAIERRFRELEASAAQPSSNAALGALAAIHPDIGRFVEASECRLLATPLVWDDDQKAEAGWLHATNLRLAALGYQLAESLPRMLGPDDPRALHGPALALLYVGDALKWEGASASKVPRDYRSLHGLMRHAISTGRQHDPIRVESGGRERPCTLESLYFRELLLARFASGSLSGKQIEILDEWLWMWAPILLGVSEPPGGSALRADLDSGEGLRHGTRCGEGPALYLPQAPLEAAFRSLVAQFHAGGLVPAEGCTADFGIEEHVAVLDLIRHDLRASRLASAPRALRHATDRVVELHLGLAEVMGRGFASAAPRPAAIVLAAKDGVHRMPGRVEHERDIALNEIYDPSRRLVKLTNVSETGLGLEGSLADCGSLAVGDLVGVRVSPAEPLVIGKVMRGILTAKPDRLVVGVRRLSSQARLVGVTATAGRGARNLSILYVPGDDASGRRDAFLVGTRAFEEGGAFEIAAGDNVYRFRFNRVRERGRGWVLAGFEILGASPAAGTALDG